jgi:hypothetical protein
MATTKDRLDELTTHERELEDHDVVAVEDRGVVDAKVPPAAAGNRPAAAVLPTSLRGRLLEALSGRWAAIGAVAWVVLLGIGIAVEPPPTNPNAVDPWFLNLLGTVLLAAVVAAFAGFWLRRRWSMAASLLASGLLVVSTVACPVSGHHRRSDRPPLRRLVKAVRAVLGRRFETAKCACLWRPCSPADLGRSLQRYP